MLYTTQEVCAFLHFEVFIMKPYDNKDKIIDTIEYNGKYRNVSVIRNRILAAVGTIVLVAVFITLPILVL